MSVAPPPHGGAGDGIRARVVNGVMWKLASAVVRQASRIVTAVILARLLSPHDYGVAGMVLVVSSLVLVFADLAFGAALIQRRELSEEDRSTAFWTNAAGGLVFTLCGVALAGPVAAFYGQPAVKPLFAAFSITFLVTALASTQSALLNREMNFRSLELRQMISYGAGAAVGIGTAASGLGAWALILQQITTAVASTILLLVFSPWRPKFTYSFASLRSMAGFSGRVFVTRLFFYVNRNIDNTLVGRFIGPAALGAYALAYNVMLMPFSQISAPIQEVLFPAFSRVQDDPGRIAAGWLRVNRLVGAITIPSLLGLIIVAPDFVRVVLGARWVPATPVIQILSWVGLLQSLQGMNSGILEARNKTQSLVRYSVVVLVASVTAFVGGLHWGIVGVATGYAISSTFVEPYYTLVTVRAVDLPLRAFLASLRGVTEAAVLMAATVLGVRLLLLGTASTPLLRLALCVGVGLLVYLPSCRWRAPELFADLQGLRRRRPRLPAVGAPQPSEP